MPPQDHSPEPTPGSRRGRRPRRQPADQQPCHMLSLGEAHILLSQQATSWEALGALLTAYSALLPPHSAPLLAAAVNRLAQPRYNTASHSRQHLLLPVVPRTSRFPALIQELLQERDQVTCARHPGASAAAPQATTTAAQHQPSAPSATQGTDVQSQGLVIALSRARGHARSAALQQVGALLASHSSAMQPPNAILCALLLADAQHSSRAAATRTQAGTGPGPAMARDAVVCLLHRGLGAPQQGGGQQQAGEANGHPRLGLAALAAAALAAALVTHGSSSGSIRAHSSMGSSARSREGLEGGAGGDGGAFVVGGGDSVTAPQLGPGWWPALRAASEPLLAAASPTQCAALLWAHAAAGQRLYGTGVPGASSR